ncbi:MAG: ATP-dependent 6-phosphofructokinase [Deltaproteobacteria bacterium]|nr:ATP-dependent 6-phosphofructokinase [Deltaproteobacteria bacterium]
MPLRIGISTGGGDAPGLNAVIRAIVKYGVGQYHWQVVGIEDAFDGLLESPRRLQTLDLRSCKGILTLGGTILGTSNRGDPFAYPDPDGKVTDRSAELVSAIRDEGLEGLISIGGDGTQKIALRLMRDHDIPVVGVPKTIDNDLSATDVTFGFMSAVQAASDALDRLHTTAEAHDRVMILEVMGRDAGWIALQSGIAGGADCILIPEIPYDVNRLVDKIERRRSLRRYFTIIVVAEGAVPAGGEAGASPGPSPSRRLGGGRAGVAVAEALTERLHTDDIRVTVLGHLQRGGTPIAFDRVLATRLGVGAVDLAQEGRWGEIICLHHDRIVGLPIEEAVAVYRTVDPDGELVRAARAVGIEFGG